MKRTILRCAAGLLMAAALLPTALAAHLRICLLYTSDAADD